MVVNKSEPTVQWLLKQRFVFDILITTDIEDWINKAVKFK